MALPTVLLKAKSSISKGLKTAKTSKEVKSATSNSNNEEVKHILGIFKIPIVVSSSIAGAIIAFVVIVFIAIVSIPQILIGAPIFGGASSSSDDISSGVIGGGSISSVVECARKQIGKPYVWAAEGPNAFDCSGLVTYCYRMALGVEVPHQTKSLYKSNKFKTVSSVQQLQAGDIILDGLGSAKGIQHVGIYTGNGTVIHARTFGDYVKEDSLETFRRWVSGSEVPRHYIGG